MPETRLKCPSCEAVLKLTAPLSPGKAIKCPKCGKAVSAPSAAGKPGGQIAGSRPGPRPQAVRKPKPEEEPDEEAEDLDDEEETRRPKKAARRAADDEDEEPRKRKRKKTRDEDGSRKKLLWIGIGGGAALVVGIVVLVFILKGSGSGGGDGKGGGKGSGTDGDGGGFSTREVDSFNTGVNVKGSDAALAVSSDGKIAVISASQGPKRIKIFDLEKKQQIAAFDPSGERGHAVLVSPGNAWVACYQSSFAKAIELRSLKTGELIRTLTAPEGGSIDRVAAGPRSDILAGAGSGEVFGWDCRTGQQAFHWKAHEKDIVGMGFLPDGKLVTSSHDHTLKIWDVNTRNAVKTIQLQGDLTLQLALSPDGKLAASMEDKKQPGDAPGSGATIYVWNLETGSKVSQMRRRLFYNTWKMRFLPDNKTLVISVFEYLGFWDATRGVNISEEKIPLESLAVTSSGMLVILYVDGILHLVEVKE
jgi:hypothetical protein